MIMGISGYTGSGKSVVAKYLSEKYNFTLIDADKTARKLMLENKKLIGEVAGGFDVVNDGKIDFSKLGSIAFQSVENLKKLNSITFPYIIPALTLEANAVDSAIIDAALLPLIKPEKICSFAIWIESEEQTRAQRLLKRSNLDIAVILNRIKKQKELMSPPTEGDYWKIAVNNSSIEDLFAQTDKIYYKYCAA
jgi:dephospho-CoA kinase